MGAFCSRRRVEGEAEEGETPPKVMEGEEEEREMSPKVMEAEEEERETSPKVMEGESSPGPPTPPSPYTPVPVPSWGDSVQRAALAGRTQTVDLPPLGGGESDNS